MIRIVPDDEAAMYLASKDHAFEPVVTPTLGEALRWFILATAVRRLRSGKAAHSSMLIHTTMRIQPQLQMVGAVEVFVGRLRDAWAGGDRTAWRRQFEDEQSREAPIRSGNPVAAFDELEPLISQVLSDVSVLADNSASTNRLIYGDDPATVIAVGGNTLSRGLTLEGLVSSFFLRSAGTYDSLLQMGRWFGYRPGYEDLPRIWTTQELAEDFRFMSEIESELRSEIARYAVENAKPIELPVRIRTHPRMQVTARNKMQFAVPGQASYSASRPQTTYFSHRDERVIQRNRAAGRQLLSDAVSAGATVEWQESRIVIRDVGADHVLAFVARFAFHEDTELRSDLVRDYISTQRDAQALDIWNVAIITRKGDGPTMDLGLDRPVPLLTRSKLSKSSTALTANIGTLMSKPDRVADLIDSAAAATAEPEALLWARNESGRALLLLYPIDKDSVPKAGATNWRERLDAVDHLLGVAFSFPQAAAGSEPADRIQVDPALLFTYTGEDDDYTYADTEGDHDEVNFDG